MNNFFNLSRFKHVLFRNLNSNRTAYMLLSGLIISIYLVTLLIVQIDESYQLMRPIIIVFFITGCIIALNPFILRFRKNEWEFLLPASIFEKYLCLIIHHLLVIPAIIGIVSYCCFKIYEAITISNISFNEPSHFNIFAAIFVIYFLVVMIIGSLIFKGKAFIKSILTAIILYYACHKFIMEFFIEPNIYSGIPPEQLEKLFNSFFNTINFVLSTLTVVLGFAGYFIMKKIKI